MKKRLLDIVAALIVAYAIGGIALALPLAVASWNARKPLMCDMVGAPYEAWSACLTWVAMANWGAQ